jgi:formylglycine-generating enzyme required for sulfatase activity
MASPDAAASNREGHSRSEARGKVPPGMVWIPGGTFLMGTNQTESFLMSGLLTLSRLLVFGWMSTM